MMTELKKMQAETNLIIPKKPFGRVVRDITQDVAGKSLRFQSGAIACLQEAAEWKLVLHFQGTEVVESLSLCLQADIHKAANEVAQHARRVTVMDKDFHLLKRLGLIYQGTSGLEGTSDRAERYAARENRAANS